MKEFQGKGKQGPLQYSRSKRLPASPTIYFFLVGERVSDKKAEGVARASVRSLHSTTLSKVTTLDVQRVSKGPQETAVHKV